MKKLFLLIVLTGISLSAMCANKVFDKYSDMKDATVMSFNFSAVKSMYNVSLADMILQTEESTDAQDSLVAGLMDKIEEMVIIKTEKKSLLRMKKDIKKLRNDYETLMSMSNNDYSLLYLFKKTDGKAENIIFMHSYTDNKAVTAVVKGDLTGSDAGKIIELIQRDKVSSSENIASEGALSGVFSVSTDKTVQFAKGNLQYQPSSDTWRFAANQYDYIGVDNHFISPSYDGWMDLFGFGTGNNPTNTSKNDTDYATFAEWGSNAVSNGGNAANGWRTLSYSEWRYLFFSRKNAGVLYGLGEINGIGGIIILPDNWNDNRKTPKFINWEDFKNASASEREKNKWGNSYSIETWKEMEKSGAVFLPCGGFRHGTNVYVGGDAGNYFTATPNDSESAYEFGFNSNGWSIHPCHRYSGCSVRLVRESE